MVVFDGFPSPFRARGITMQPEYEHGAMLLPLRGHSTDVFGLLSVADRFVGYEKKKKPEMEEGEDAATVTQRCFWFVVVLPQLARCRRVFRSRFDDNCE